MGLQSAVLIYRIQWESQYHNRKRIEYSRNAANIRMEHSAVERLRMRPGVSVSEKMQLFDGIAAFLTRFSGA